MRSEAEKASNHAVSESAALKIELAKKDERIINLQNTGDAITQKLKSLEQTSNQTEQIINKYINSVSHILLSQVQSLKINLNYEQ